MSSNLPVDPSQEPTEISRNNLGQFVKGVSGNPAGRAKGSKNRTVLMKQALEEAAVRGISEDFLEILQTAIDLAKSGDKDMIKLILNDFQKEIRRADVEEGETGPKTVEISITQYFGPEKRASNAAAEAIDAQFEEIKANTGLAKP